MTQTCEATNTKRLWIFKAGFFLGTPLRELVRHGEIMHGERNALPVIADEASRSAWEPVHRCWQASEDIDIDIDAITLESVDSDIGPVPADGADYLPFLIKFRRIIESGLSHDQLANVLEQMLSSNASYMKFFEKHGSIVNMLRLAGVPRPR